MKYGFSLSRKKDLEKEYVRRLIEVNDESKTLKEHIKLQITFQAWKDGVEDATGVIFNGDYYYIPLIDAGYMKDRPMCCGIFLDWKPNAT